MEDVTVAIVGTGPAGLTALKSLREEGFDAVAFERREAVGGLWAYSYDPEYTSALDDTMANISKFVASHGNPILTTRADMSCVFACRSFLWLTKLEYPPYLSRRQIHEYFESYAKHFELHRHISFGTTVKQIDDYKGKRVMVVGIGNTGCEVALSLRKHASKTYQAYRRGRMVASRYGDDGVPTDSLIPWPILRLKYLLDYWVPWLTNPFVDKFMVNKMINDAARHEPVSPDTPKKERLRLAEEKVRGEWRLVPCPSLAHKHPALQENFFPALYSQEITPVHGFVDFVGDKKVILGNGQIVEVDVVIFATGYKHDFSLMPELEMDGAAGFPLTTPGEVDDRKEPSLPRLFQMIFPPKWASSVAFLSWMAPQENVWCVCELASMAVTQVWAADVAQKKDLKAPAGYRPASLLPSKEEMDKEVDSYHAWWRKQWTVDHSGPMNSYSWRLFDTNPLQIPGRGRKTWSGARKAVEEAVSDATLLTISELTRCSVTFLRILKQSRGKLSKDVIFLRSTTELDKGRYSLQDRWISGNETRKQTFDIHY
ncbi:uncharacterized protein NECHADRAFT_54967 [Fusarium vanettenii 77-13-4]|uniref:FAD/NAD(P)-binding domain-containing protein n=1 Tax=Fusarium vanettenii (strain ATCC MYA-4622 / CBS 123669 / FGSC 9596 / NRRL 45880 / 77-13-4) TaxID=660122 RepID=C7ZDS8_FUSV7|nr:uncharacterized protein NECHADRAFT_54967 [Fusarium vanettenii 77-13-4]EEU37804.1 hypothetical protein NECHADRAFT_54967 [Fusarium vanettenii 77-13-4]